MGFAIRRLTRADGAGLKALRLKALADTPEAFAEALGDAEKLSAGDWQTRAENECIYGLFEGETLSGMSQVDRYQSKATRHKAWLTAVYLEPSLRGRGAGRALLTHTIEDSRKQGILQLHLGVGDYNEAVKSLYASLGFEVYGLEPRGLFAGNRFVDEYLMVLHLDKEATA